MLRLHPVSTCHHTSRACSGNGRDVYHYNYKSIIKTGTTRRRGQTPVELQPTPILSSSVWIGTRSRGLKEFRGGKKFTWNQRGDRLHQSYRLLLEKGGGASAADRLCAARNMSKMNPVLPISVPPGTIATLKEDHKEGKVKTQRMTRRGALVALSYMGCAVMLVMFNKAALSSYSFPCANVITVLQMICSTALLFLLRSLNVITFAGEGNGVVDLAADGFVPMRTLKRTAPLSIAYLFYMVVGMASIRGVNVPMYTTLRRTTVLFTMVMEYFLAGQKHSSPIVSSVGVIVLGAFIAGARDLSFDAQGYMTVLLSNLTTAIYLSTISRIGKTTGLNSFGLMWCNGVICGPILFFWIIVSGELGKALQFPAVFFPGFQLVIVLSCMMAFCLNYTIFLNTSLNSPLTQTMCGNLKDLGTVLIGWLWFGGLPFDWLNVIGQFLGFVGSGVYAYCKLKGK
ncbi:hypothetical protein R1flu_000271 [Riccia fluitans]|uniref:Sugar phosphate transporter domain-containing protein n=1 Tax=Riccia fluitans TaxID=41844 RepID=A0ABD1XZZ3_9MARC